MKEACISSLITVWLFLFSPRTKITSNDNIKSLIITDNTNNIIHCDKKYNNLPFASSSAPNANKIKMVNYNFLNHDTTGRTSTRTDIGTGIKTTLVSSILLPAILVLATTTTTIAPTHAAALLESPVLSSPSPSHMSYTSSSSFPSSLPFITSSSSSSSGSSSSSTENYLPRKLYPGTYKNYCGPTPEIKIRNHCQPHGWHGDEPLDQVDEVCKIHDISYCNCQSQLLSRNKIKKLQQQKQPLSTTTNGEGVIVQEQEEEEIPLLASIIALRFLVNGNKELLEKTLNIDDEYLNCINKADRNLVIAGLQIRSEQQRSNCINTDPSLKWFCKDVKENEKDKQVKTLDAFEKVNLAIFLKDLDSDNYNIKDIVGNNNSKDNANIQENEKLFMALRAIAGSTSNNDNNNIEENQKLSLALRAIIDTKTSNTNDKKDNNNIVVIDNLMKKIQKKSDSKMTVSLSQLEQKRHNDFINNLNRGKPISDAVLSDEVQQDEKLMLLQLSSNTAYTNF